MCTIKLMAQRANINNIPLANLEEFANLIMQQCAVIADEVAVGLLVDSHLDPSSYVGDEIKARFYSRMIKDWG